MTGNDMSHVRAAKRSQRTGLAAPYVPVVYALLDPVGAPLYVGSSITMESRMKTHRHTQPWWSEAAFVTWTRVAAGQLGSGRYEPERHVTLSLAPKYNVSNNGGEETATLFAQRRLEALARSARHPDVRILRRPLEEWIEAIASRSIVGSTRWQAAVIAPGPVSKWAAA